MSEETPNVSVERRTSRTALRFVLLIGVLSFFADFTYEGSRSILGPYLALLQASGTVVGVVTGFGELGAGRRPACAAWTRDGASAGFAVDSPLEEAGFEPSVPRDTKVLRPSHVASAVFRQREIVGANVNRYRRGRWASSAGPIVRIHLPPAVSPVRT
jgi:hypothetical protein